MVQWSSLKKAQGCQDGKSWKAGRTVKCHLLDHASHCDHILLANYGGVDQAASAPAARQGWKRDSVRDFRKGRGVIAFNSVPTGDPFRFHQSVPQMALIKRNRSQRNKNVCIWEGNGQG